MERGPCARRNKDFERSVGTVRFGSGGKNHITRSCDIHNGPGCCERSTDIGNWLHTALLIPREAITYNQDRICLEPHGRPHRE
jgi:hypothetical protein